MIDGRNVVNEDTAGLDEPGRRWSLRREWCRGFTVMLVLLLAAAAATTLGGRSLDSEMKTTAGQLQLESKTIAALRAGLHEHEQLGHQLLNSEPVDRSAFVQQQQEISRLFAQAATVFPDTYSMRAIIAATQRSWQNGLTASGLWGDQVSALRGNHSGENVAYDTSNENTGETLNGLDVPSREAMAQGLARGADLQRKLIIVLTSLFMVASAVTVYFRRRMVKDLLRPVAAMHEGVFKLQNGDYNNRIKVARLDELGELAQSFNRMAEALHSSNEALTLRATHDSLTGLANRATLSEHLTASFRPGCERRARQISLLFIDIDDFKDVNDTVGHEGGDALLVQLATRLGACIRAQDLVARLGGDEFAIMVMEDDDGSSVAVQVAERVLNALHEPFLIGGEFLVVTVSIGVAQRRPETGDAAELLREADFAMYMAKGGGKACYELFDAQMHDHMLGRSELKTN